MGALGGPGVSRWSSRGEGTESEEQSVRIRQLMQYWWQSGKDYSTWRIRRRCTIFGFV